MCLDDPDRGMIISGSGTHEKNTSLIMVSEYPPIGNKTNFVQPIDPTKHKLYNFWILIHLQGGHDVYMGPYNMSVGCTPIFKDNQHKVLLNYYCGVEMEDIFSPFVVGLIVIGIPTLAYVMILICKFGA